MQTFLIILPPSLSLSDINECENGTDNCHADAQCIDTVGSFSCSCLPGFRGDGVMTCAGTKEYLFTAAAIIQIEMKAQFLTYPLPFSSQFCFIFFFLHVFSIENTLKVIGRSLIMISYYDLLSK